MSGTSLDAIDAALVCATPDNQIRLAAAISYPIPPELKSELEALCRPGQNEIDRAGQADKALGLVFAQAVHKLLSESGHTAADISAIGCHGQTIRHRPDAALPFTLQIGDPNTLAYQTGITTVADFRRMDIAAGGQGAPLVPAFHDHILRDNHENRVVVNIGGMANITVLARNAPVTGWDTGPGNILLDSWCMLNQGTAWDNEGRWAHSGKCSETLLAELLQHPFFSLPPPKSTGRESFNLAWLQSVLLRLPEIAAADVQRTLLELTARTITGAILQTGLPTDRLLLCGGGSHNTLLKERIAELATPTRVDTTTDFGIPADWVEAMAFAWLAKARLESIPGNIPLVTGASRPCVLGGIYLAP